MCIRDSSVGVILVLLLSSNKYNKCCYCEQKEIREEDRRYREYLRQLREEERRREKEIELMCDAEVDKMWEKRSRQWKIEKMARQKLLEEVLESRRQQIQQKCTSENVRFLALLGSTISPKDDGLSCE